MHAYGEFKEFFEICNTPKFATHQEKRKYVIIYLSLERNSCTSFYLVIGMLTY
jgi:hypothetical protein